MSKVYRKLTAVGGKGGQEWDDDVHKGVRKVSVGQDGNRITYVKFEYVTEDDEGVTRDYGIIQEDHIEFEVEYPEEHITAVGGYYGAVGLLATDVITNLIFTTSNGRQSPLFGPVNVTSRKRFDIEDGGKKIAGFHGRSGNAIDAFGVYFVHHPLPPVYKLDAQGGTNGSAWDDGTYDNVKSISICKDNSRITYLKFQYEKAGVIETRQHGTIGQEPLQFVLNPAEYIKSVEVTYEDPMLTRNITISSLKFETSERGFSEIYGYHNSRKKFVLKSNNGKLIGFHGKEGDAIDALGAYFTPIPIE